MDTLQVKVGEKIIFIIFRYHDIGELVMEFRQKDSDCRNFLTSVQKSRPKQVFSDKPDRIFIIHGQVRRLGHEII